MNSNPQNDHLKIYDKLLELSELVYGGEDEQKSLIEECIDFQKKWNIMIGAEMIPAQSKNNFINEYTSIKERLSCNTKKCVILGRTSSGKSTLINALLTKEVLPTSFGSTSNCFVEIKASLTNENYLIISNVKRNIEEIEDLNNLLSDRHLENGSCITTYYDKNKCELLEDDVVIIDTPGYDSGIFDDNLKKKYFSDADIVVLVVNAQSGINDEDERLLKGFKTALEKLNLVIIFNFWDVVNPKDRNGRIKVQLLGRAKRILREVLNIDDTHADTFIFFVSSDERISSYTVDNSVNSAPLWNERNTSFGRFYDYLKKEMSESLLKKKCKCLQNLKCMLECSYNQCQNSITVMKTNRFNLQQNITNELENIEGLFAKVYQIISEIFNHFFESLIIEGLDLVKAEKTKYVENKKNPRNGEYEIISFSGNRTEIINSKYRELLKNITGKNLENAKNKIINFIEHEDRNVSSFRENIFNEIYFPSYFNLNKELNLVNIESFRNSLMEINGKINILYGITIPLASFLLAAVPLAPIIALPEMGIVAVGGGIGGGIGAGAAFGGIKITRLPFHFAWKKHESVIRNLWNSFESDLINNYLTFVDLMQSNVTELITPIEEKSAQIQNKLNNIEEELKILRYTH